ncbi:SET and MYND domain-containing protein 4 [Oryzias melastigma]|uniref:Protein-lysine N-methyltransferase SMYD4 n=1 Tax=Oryzias melastigma TaxID=30732 RepID=A0A3B3DDH8_ORYME|nr:SET and MYND domain-containing protein 4 [Oryzias melastigma]
MDLPCVQWQNHVARKWSSLHAGMREIFPSLVDVDDIFKYGLSQTTHSDLDFMKSVSDGYLMKKDPEQAVKYREKGNSHFKAADYKVATLHYSQGICFAPSSSEQLSLCYANRSAALYHLNHYQDCLADIERALKAGYPSHLSHKLQDRRTMCLNQLCKKTTEDNPSLCSNGKARVSASNVRICPKVTIDYNLEKGRHLVAVERIEPGDVILTDRPYSFVLIPEIEETRKKDARTELFGTQHRRCHQCLAETLCPVPCEGCSYSRYCSVRCQREAWEEHHCWECSLEADLMAMGIIAHLALRITLKAGLKTIQEARQPVTNRHEEANGLINPNPCSDEVDPFASHYGDSYMSVFHLLHHISHQSTAVRFLYAITAAALCMKLSEAGLFLVSRNINKHSSANSPLPCGPKEEEGDAEQSSEQWLLGSTILRHMLQLRCNAQAITVLQDKEVENSRVQSQQEIRIATAMFPSLSLLNHSCSPNTTLVFSTVPADEGCVEGLADISISEERREIRGVSVTVRAARVISPGQEVLHCYGPHSSRMVAKDRQRLLQEQYYFLCQCEACSNPDKDEEANQPGVKGRPSEAGLLCFKCKAVVKKSHEGRFLCSTCSYQTTSAEVSNKLQEIRIVLEKAVHLMEKERPAEALQLLKQTESHSGLMLAQTHPLQGELADATARAYATMGEWKKAASHLERGAAATSSQYGEDSVELGQQLFKLVQLHFNGGARSQALAVIPKVRRLFLLHCGPHCPELLELKAMEDCLRG